MKFNLKKAAVISLTTSIGTALSTIYWNNPLIGALIGVVVGAAIEFEQQTLSDSPNAV